MWWVLFMDISEKSSSLWHCLSQCGWELSPDKKSSALVVRVTGKEEAHEVHKKFREVLCAWAFRFSLGSVIIRYGSKKWDFFEVDVDTKSRCASSHYNCENDCFYNASTMLENVMNTDVPIVYFTSNEIFTPILVRQGDEIQSSEQDICLVRNHDNQNIITSRLAALAINVDGRETVKRNNADYIQGTDLVIIHQNHRLYGETPFTVTYTATSDKPKYYQDAIWQEITATIHYIQNEFGIWYRKSTLLNMKQVGRPGLVF